MGKFIKILAWIFTGAVGAHAGHYLYQKYYVKEFAALKFSESIAVIWTASASVAAIQWENKTPVNGSQTNNPVGYWLDAVNGAYLRLV